MYINTEFFNKFPQLAILNDPFLISKPDHVNGSSILTSVPAIRRSLADPFYSPVTTIIL